VASYTERGEELTYTIVPYPKSDSSRRELGLPEGVVSVLRDHLEVAPTSDLVFPSREGRLLHPSNFRRRAWAPALVSFLATLPGYRRKQLEAMTFHDLRHTHCSLLIAYGWTESQIVARMGWRDGRMLHRVYGHLFRRHDQELVADLSKRMKERPNREVGGANGA
jgi:integrase